MVKGCLLKTQNGDALHAEPLNVYLFATGGYFDMPQPVVRTGYYILKVQENERSVIVNATTHDAAYFRFVNE